MHFTQAQSNTSSQMHLQWLTFDSPYWQRGPWNPAGHWHMWGPSSEHFPPLKQVSAAQSTNTNRTKQSGFCLFCAKDSPELPLLVIVCYNSNVQIKQNSFQVRMQIFIMLIGLNLNFNKNKSRATVSPEDTSKVKNNFIGLKVPWMTEGMNCWRVMQQWAGNARALKDVMYVWGNEGTFFQLSIIHLE